MSSQNKKSILINASNLHVGGGKQVAVSLLYELSKLDYKELDLHIICSSQIDSELKKLKINFESFKSYKIINVFGLQMLFSKLNTLFKQYDLVFSIFGPIYFFNKNTIHLSGFAQAQIIYSTNQHKWQKDSSLMQRFLDQSKYFIKKLAFKRMDGLFVELEHVKHRLVSQKIFHENQIEVIHNSVSSIFFKKSEWKDIELEKETSYKYIGTVSNDYRHKNLSILPSVQRILNEEYNILVKFIVTFSEEEWVKKDAHFREKIINIGPLESFQLPRYYQQLDGVVFPSLLESFSITPLEALVMEKPLFASDLPFIRDCCSEYANYFNPFSEESIAYVIADFFNNPKQNLDIMLHEGKQHALDFSSPIERAEKTLRMIENTLTKKRETSF